MAPAKTGGIDTDPLAIKIAFKKLWKRSRSEEKEGSKSTDTTESQEGLDERTRKSCETTWKSKHGFPLAPGRRLVSTQLVPMHRMSHMMSPDPKDFSLLPLRRMRLQDGSVDAQSADSELGSSYIIYLKARAFFLSYAFVNIDQTWFFSLEAAETINDKILAYLHARHAQGRPPVAFFAEAWENMARTFQLGVRAGRPLLELTAADTMWQHYWTVYQPTPKPPPSTREAPQQNSKGKAGSKGTRDGSTGDTVRTMQQRKDREIADLKRQLKTEQSGTSSSRGQGHKEARKW